MWVHLDSNISFTLHRENGTSLVSSSLPSLKKKRHTLKLNEYEIYSNDQVKPFIFEFSDEIYAIVLTHGEIVITKLFKNDYPVVLTKLSLGNKEFITSISDSEFSGDRVFLLYLTNLGNIALGYVALPTEIDPQFHSEIIHLSGSSSGLFGSLVNFTKSLLSLKQASGSDPEQGL